MNNDNDMIYRNRYLLKLTILLAVLLTGGSAMAGVVVKGSVYGGGNQADVQTNTTVNISAGQVEGNVYGGGNLGDVGNITKNTTDYNYSWTGKNNSANYPHNNTITGTNNNTGVCTVIISGGTIGTTGSSGTDYTDVATGNVFGGGKGNRAATFYCQEGMVFATSVTISGSTTVHGCVFGGGEIGRVEDDTKVTISGTSNDGIKGNVFGAGEGLPTHGYSALVRGNTEVTVEGNAKIGHSVYGGGETASVGKFNVVGGSPATPAGGGGCTVIIQGSAQIGGDVYGAGMGLTPDPYTYNIDDKNSMPYRMMAKSMGSFTTENQKIWDNVDENNVKEYFPTRNIYLDFLRTLALASTPTVTIGGTATINGSVFGGGKLGITLGNVNVSMTGGTVNENVYGGGSLADTNTGNWSLDNYESPVTALKDGESITDLFTRENTGTEENPKYKYSRIYDESTPLSSAYRRVPIWANATNKSAVYKTHVSLTGGEIVGDAYGGGLGQIARAAVGDTPALEDVEALVYGDVMVELNGKTTNGTLTEVASDAKGCIVKRVFGCNNLNGTPKGLVQVYVYATQNANKATVSTDKTKENLNNGTYGPYDVMAVYGGGNLAPYIPVDALLDYSVEANKAAVEAVRTEVYIYGCDRTSIKQVYAGGNAASVASSFVQVNSVYEIEEVFGGGNGADPYYVYEKKYLNPGANVGYYNYTHFGDSGKGTGAEADPYQPVDNTDPDASTKENRQANYRYGSGIARTEIRGGRVHVAYGGSNKKGNISTTAFSIYDGSGDCPMSIDQTYGGGKDAPIDGEVVVELACATGVEEIFGGAKNADINSDVNLIVTNGSSLNRVFGGNNTSGAINGSITVTIKEGGCEPIRIGELYLGGYLAPYSVYGYKQTNGVYDYIETTDEEGNTIHERIPLKAGESGALSTPRNDPRIFVVSATHIGNIFGGGYKAKLVGNPHINVNMEPGKVYVTKVEKTTEVTELTFTEDNKTYVYKDGAGTIYDPDDVTPETTGGQTKYVAALSVGEIGNIYGGGNMADVIGDTYVEIGTGTMHNNAGVVEDITPARNAAHITGNVYGGGNLGDIGYLDDDTKENDPNSLYHNTHVIICAKEVTENNETVWKSVAAGTAGVTIGGNVYGGGMGEPSSFKCEKAMVVGNTNVIIGNGTIGTLEGAEGSQTLKAGTGNVYGGGQIARVERSSEVTIGLAPSEEGGTSTPVILNDVFGAGAGIKTHGYSALVRHNSTVTVQGNAKVKHNVYGGGEIASVGRYKVKNKANASEAPDWVAMGMPFALISGGVSTVTVQGNAVIGPDAAMTMPDFKGHVFGAGKGVTPDVCSYVDKDNKPWRMMAYDSENPTYKTGEGVNWDYVSETDHQNVWEYFKDEDAYFQFLETLALSDKTDVTIDGDAFVKGSVYGGSENGHVRTDTYVKIKDGQIGCATGMTVPYADGVFIDPSTTAITTSLATCPSWTYTDNGYTYDKFANAEDGTYSYTGDYAVIPEAERLTSSEGGRPTATDGHTFYGNVFGGGSGYFPYAPGKWYRGAGSVGGDTRVDIEGGHVLSSVYGGNEQTDVGTYRSTPTTMPESGGNCIVNIMGGTVGVPRTKTAIQAHPVIGNVFGAGKGDKRVLFNTWTNVAGSRVNVKSGIVYGSVFGGGEDGHVLGNDSTYITQASGKTITIGSTGESGADGNVFGGGRGSETALTAGVVGGNVLLEVNSGTILGSVYGGGRLASVGTNFVNPTIPDPDHDGEVIPNPDYGTMQTPEADHGNITVTINGGTIGTNNVNSTGIGGNIYGGSKGTTANFRLGIVRSTAINMTGGTAYASVYGGGELAQVIGSHTTGSKALGTEIKISGGTIGISGKGTATWGNVYGAGKGNTTDVEAGLVKTNTSVTISETDATNKPTAIYHNIYGGGAYGSVGTITRGSVDYVIGVIGQTSVADMPTAWEANTGLAEVTILGGTIGVDGEENGMIFGSSRGDVGAPGAIHDKLAWVKDTKVVIGASGTDGPNIKGSVYGSGENGHTFHDTDVKVHSGTIGIASGADVVVTNKDNSTTTYAAYNYPYRGNVYGGGCGTDTYNVVENEKTYKKYNPLAGIVLGDANVTVDGGHVVHNVYGAGAMGSVGTIDNDEIVPHNSYTDDGKESYYNFGLSWPVKFVYKTDADSELTGKTTVKIEGTAIIGVTNSDAKGGHIFGAARGGVDVGQTGIADQRYEEAKLANVRETEVFIGTSSGANNTTTPTIHGSVYGGGEDGHVYEDANITIYHGTIAHSVFGGGKGESTYKTKLWSAQNTPKDTEEAVHSWTAGKVYGNTHVTMNAGSVGYNIYGGGNLASVGKGNYSGGSDDYSEDGYGEHPEDNEDNNAGLWTNTENSDSYLFLNSGIAYVNIYGGTVGKDLATDTENGQATGFPRGNVFGSSRGVAAPSGSQSPRYRYKPDFFLGYVNKTIVTIGDDTHTAPKIYGSVYGGGQDGHVRNSTLVTIHKGEIGRNGDTNIERGNVFGAGSGTGKYDSNGDGNADACNYSSGSVSCITQIDIEGSTTDTKIYGNVYGGGALASVGPPFTGVQKINGIAYDEVKTVKTGNNKASVSYAKVNVKGGTISGSVYGASRGPSDALMGEAFDESDDDHTYNPKKYATVIWSDVNVTGAATIAGSVYGGGEKGIVKHATNVNIGTTGDDGVEYTGTIGESVYGGGKEAEVGGKVTVNINSGTVSKDVYGGGALADTNTNKDKANATTTTGAKVTDDTATIAITGETNSPTTTVKLLGGTVKGDAYGGGLGRLGTAVAGVHYTAGEAAAYNEAHSLHVGDEGYVTTADWKEEPVAAADGAGSVKATVYGNITVQLGDAGPTNATQFNITKYAGKDIVKSGRVFGCNNLNGSPQGNVTVDVYKTVETFNNIERTELTRNAQGKVTAVAEPHTYELAAVYGGGNLANYAPTASGKKTNVIIETCDVSIEAVYGGGNAAAVPETNVLVNGAHQIESVFGGGNGRDQYTLDNGSTWVKNPGANVNGNATTLINGGLVHEAYGGSNKKGTITGNVSIDLGSGGACVLDVRKLVAAGKNADVEGDLIVVLGCKDSEVPVLYAGADNANVNGNVELTITSGRFGKVFGGNNEGGAIRGHIKLNIEETGECDPIIIDELYLGGDKASYSQYGYYNANTDEDDDPVWMPISKEMTAAGANHKDPVVGRIDEREDDDPNLYAAPELNIVACTYIGKVFGGGLGTTATTYGNPKVNINMIPGSHANSVPTFMTTDSRLTALSLDSSENPNKLGVIGTVYGGGNEADVDGNPTVNIGTASKVRLHTAVESVDDTGVATYTLSGENNVLGAYVVGNVYGGGKGEAKTEAGTAGEAFLCAKAMVNGDVGTHVNIGNGFVRGNVYGGGEVGRVEHNTAVKIGLDAADIPQGKTSAPVIRGNVFGAGKGVNTHGYSALVRGNSTVTVQADSKVEGSIYGGGEVASVGKYSVVNGLPVALAPDEEHPNSGYCYVNILGNAEIGPDNMEMTKDGGPSDSGHVFGAGKGVLPYEGYDDPNAEPFHMNGSQVLVDGVWDKKSWNDAPTNYPKYNPAAELDADYVKFIKSLALATQTVVNISGNPFIKGSVYGGSENGFVQQDTHVTISGGQIGNGYVQMDDDGTYLATKKSVDRRYTEAEWAAGYLIDNLKDGTTAAETGYTSSLPECASWQYGAPYAPYDKFADASGNYPEGSAVENAEGGRLTGSDGHTFYGNVFGGGSGYYPYKPGRWFEDAGAVYGNTQVDITGGHILTSIYGGNEMTDVSGTCTVNFGGTATLGVKRTLKQIDAHPVTCYLFGAGKGDQRVFFNKSTNVQDVVVNITGGTIYGSVFGGGEDGHVLRDVKMTIENTTVDVPGEGDSPATTTTITPTIGTWGTSYVDGNVFGGGRGFGGDAYTAGNVAGSVKMEVKGGSILGSIYGGGRLGSVGYGLFESTDETGRYGTMRPDDKSDDASNSTTTFYKDGPVKLGRGYVDITISGGTIGNTHEYIVPTAGNIPSGLSTDFSNWSPANWTTWKEHNNIPKTEFDASTGHLTHTKGGNVFAGGMGRQKSLSGADISGINWWKLGSVKQTKLTITGGTIKSNVYGGGELGAVLLANGSTTEGGKTEISISGSSTVIGSEVKNGNDVIYTFGNVFGGGMGNEYDTSATTHEQKEDRTGGCVKASTKITMSAGTVNGNVYGGGELGYVGISTYNTTTKDYSWTGTTGLCSVGISGGTVTGHVFGAGKGSDATFDCERAMVRETTVGISAGAVNGNVYGGGEVGRVDQDTEVTIGEGDGSGSSAAPVIGENVFGAGAGVETHGYSGLVRGNATVIVQGDAKVGQSVYGGGETAAVGRYGLDEVGMPSTLVSGGECAVTIKGYAHIGPDGVSDDSGHVFGAGKGVEPHYYVGVDSYSTDAEKPKRMDSSGQWEYFNTREKYLNFLQTLALATDTKVSIEGNATINCSVYGGSESGFVQRDTEVKIKDNSTIGTASTAGNVFGGGRGFSGFDKAGRVRGNATTTVSGGTIAGNVYGGGELGFVGKFSTSEDGREYTWEKIRGINDPVNTKNYDTGLCTVTITGGKIGPDNNENKKKGNVYGAGKGEALTFKCEPALVRTTSVNIGNATVNGNVYGGGEVGRVDQNTVVNIGLAHNAVSGTTYYQKQDGTDTYNAVEVTEGSSVVGYYTSSGEGDSYTLIENDEPIINGNVFGAGAGVKTHGYSALVRGNTTVTVQGNAKVKKNVYGGGEIAAVGKYTLNSNNMPVSLVSDGLGICNVTVKDNALIGPAEANAVATETTGHVFGAGQGVEPNYVYDATSQTTLDESSKRMTISGGNSVWEYFDKKAKYLTFLETLALATQTNVTIDGNAKVKGNVYGGSESGFVQHNVSVSIQGGCEIGTEGTNTYGNIYGGGKGLEEFSAAGRVSGYTKLTINGGTMHGSVYGGGENGFVVNDVVINMLDGEVKKHVYGGGALANTNTGSWNEYVLVDASTFEVGVTPVNGYYTDSGNTYTEITDASAKYEASINYYQYNRGWADAIKKSALYTTTVNLLGGKIVGDTYGGGLGRLETTGVPAVEAKVYGDVKVNLNGLETTDYDEAIHAAKVQQAADNNYVLKTSTSGAGTQEDPTVTTYSNGAIVNRVFGCNNLNGSPQGHVKVHVFATQNTDEATYATIGKKPDKNTDSYDVAAVYGGGNLAKYEPMDPTLSTPLNDTKEYTEVIIDGCDLTSIESVYGGGNAAPVPATEVVVNGTYEIGEVFGGGNGKDKVSYDGGLTEKNNLGADVGYRNYSTWDAQGKAVDASDADTKEKRAAYAYGDGTAHAMIYGGIVHEVFGGSNTRGNVRKEARATLEDQDGNDCDFDVDEAYGGGNNAEMDGDAVLEIGCINGLRKVCGGAANADVNGNVALNITNGTYSQVFGGNDLGGAIRGSITVNIEEIGCRPIIIGELYGGGNRAAYSVYGYNASGGVLTSGESKQDDPVVNVKSFTSIGKIFGGGYGAEATMVANPTVNINVYQGKYCNTFGTSDNIIENNAKVVGSAVKYPADNDPQYGTGYPVPTHAKGAIGAINSVFGAGNEAKVIGNPTVNIGTEAGEEVYAEVKVKTGDSVEGYFTRTEAVYTAASGTAVEGTTYYQKNVDTGEYTVANIPTGDSVEGYYTHTEASYTAATGDAVAGTTYYLKTAKAVDIRGNVYGGGNNAEVEGDTNVVIGKDGTTVTP